MIIRARTVVTMDGAPIDNGAVEVHGDTIASVGRWAELGRSSSGDVVDLGESALLPGLINAHCHLDYTCLRGAIARQPSFTDWIRAINARKATLTTDDYVDSITSGFAEATKFGTTTIANFTAFPELIARVPPVAMRTWWFAEMIDVRAPVSAAAVGRELQSVVRPLAHGGLAPHAPFTASLQLYRDAAMQDLPLSTHLAESREEMLMFRDGSGPLFEFMQQIGRPMDDCGRQTPLARCLEAGVLDERWIVAHLNELTPGDFQLLAAAPRFHIAHCPRSHAYFQHAPFAYGELRQLGFNISLGTDSLASNADLSLFAEMREFQRQQPSVSAREMLEMITVNPAAALRQGDALGRIRAGFAADLRGVASAGAADEVFENIVAHRGEVSWSMAGGIIRK